MKEVARIMTLFSGAVLGGAVVAIVKNRKKGSVYPFYPGNYLRMSKRKQKGYDYSEFFI